MAEANAVKTRTHWEDDADVLQCQRAEECPLGDGSAGVTFTMSIRKHHCRFCGKIFCYKCTPNNIKIRLTTTKGKKDFRACHACKERYEANRHELPLRLGFTHQRLDEDDPEVAAWRDARPKGWGASLPSWGGPRPVFRCKLFVRAQSGQSGDAPIGSRDLSKFIGTVRFKTYPNLTSPAEESFAIAPPFEHEFLTDTKGPAKIGLQLKDGAIEHKQTVSLSEGKEDDGVDKTVKVCLHPIYQLDGADLLHDISGKKGLKKVTSKVKTGMLGDAGRALRSTSSVSSDGSLTPRTSDSQEAADWLESNSLDAQLAKEQEHKAAVWAAAAAGLEPPKTPPREPEPEPELVPRASPGSKLSRAMNFRVQQRVPLSASFEPGAYESGRWLEVGQVVEVLEAKWIGDDEDEQQRVCVPTAPLPSPSIA